MRLDLESCRRLFVYIAYPCYATGFSSFLAYITCLTGAEVSHIRILTKQTYSSLQSVTVWLAWPTSRARAISPLLCIQLFTILYLHLIVLGVSNGRALFYSNCPQ